MVEPLPESGFLEIARFLLGCRRRYRISGHSMEPALKPGDEVLYAPFRAGKQMPDLGQVVIVDHPYRSGVRMIKRVCSTTPGGKYLVQGDNSPESTDSRSFGPIGEDRIVGVVTSRFG